MMLSEKLLPRNAGKAASANSSVHHQRRGSGSQERSADCVRNRMLKRTSAMTRPTMANCSGAPSSSYQSIRIVIPMITAAVTSSRRSASSSTTASVKGTSARLDSPSSPSITPAATARSAPSSHRRRSTLESASALAFCMLSLLLKMSGKPLEAVFERHHRGNLIASAKRLRVAVKGNVFRRGALVGDARLQPKRPRRPPHDLIDRFAVAHTQVHYAEASSGSVQRGQQGANGVVDVHRVDVIVAIAQHAKLRIALEGKTLHQSGVQLARRLMRAKRAKKANDGGAPGRLAMGCKGVDIVFRRQLGDGIGQGRRRTCGWTNRPGLAHIDSARREIDQMIEAPAFKRAQQAHHVAAQIV